MTLVTDTFAKLFLAAALWTAGVLVTACRPTAPAGDPDLFSLGGVYVAHNTLSGCRGCESIRDGDLILAMDDRPVSSRSDLDAMMSGRPVKLRILDHFTRQDSTVTVVAAPHAALPPLERAPPLFLVGASELGETPAWARNTLFGRASPALAVVDTDGAVIDGRDLYGKRRLLVFWDSTTLQGRQSASVTLELLEDAHQDLDAAGVDVLVVHFSLVTADAALRPMSDAELRSLRTSSASEETPALKIYRTLNAVEWRPGVERGLGGDVSYLGSLRAAPAVVLLDAWGVVRWHSEARGSPPYESMLREAIAFALRGF